MGQLVADVTSGPGRRGRRRLRRVLLGSVVALLVLALACGWYVDHRLVGQLGRVHGVFDGLSGRPPAVGATVVLLVIEKPDASAPSSWLPGAGTAVSVQLVEVRHGGREVHSLALPLASSFPDGSTVEDVAATRSPVDLVSRVEQASGRRIQHLAVVDSGYIDGRARSERGLQLDDAYHSPEEIRRTFDVPARTSAQVRAQQTLLDPIIAGTLHQEFRKHPLELWRALDLAARHTSVDSGWSGPQMALTVVSLRNLRSAQIQFDVAPVRCEGATCALVPPPRGDWG